MSSTFPLANASEENILFHDKNQFPWQINRELFTMPITVCIVKKNHVHTRNKNIQEMQKFLCPMAIKRSVSSQTTLTQTNPPKQDNLWQKHVRYSPVTTRSDHVHKRHTQVKIHQVTATDYSHTAPAAQIPSRHNHYPCDRLLHFITLYISATVVCASTTSWLHHARPHSTQCTAIGQSGVAWSRPHVMSQPISNEHAHHSCCRQ